MQPLLIRVAFVSWCNRKVPPWGLQLGLKLCASLGVYAEPIPKTEPWMRERETATQQSVWKKKAWNFFNCVSRLIFSPTLDSTVAALLRLETLAWQWALLACYACPSWDCHYCGQGSVLRECRYQLCVQDWAKTTVLSLCECEQKHRPLIITNLGIRKSSFRPSTHPL